MPRHDNQSEMNEVLMNVMTSLAEKSGKQFMTAVELREMMQATGTPTLLKYIFYMLFVWVQTRFFLK